MKQRPGLSRIFDGCTQKKKGSPDGKPEKASQVQWRWAAIRAEHNVRAGERKETQRATEAEGRERMREALQPTVL